MPKNTNSKQLHILLADDDTDDCIFFDKALQTLPVTTYLTIVSDGEQLMDYLNENSEQLPYVLFLDLNMPRKNGFECLSEIKENIKLKDLPVFMFSTSFPRDRTYELEMINLLMKVGADHYIRKPSDFEQFKQVIHNAIIMMTEKRCLTTQAQICDQDLKDQ